MLHPIVGRLAAAGRDLGDPRTGPPGHVDFRGWKTWYRVTGDLPRPRPPLVVLHGGPGATHDYLASHRAASPSRAARSSTTTSSATAAPPTCPTRARTSGPSSCSSTSSTTCSPSSASPTATTCSASPGAACWPPSTPSRRPTGLRGLVIANSPASMELWLSEANRLRAAAARRRCRRRCSRHEAAGTTDHARVRRGRCRSSTTATSAGSCPCPPEVDATFAAIEADPTVYHTMNGPSEFHVIGTLQGLVDHRPARPDHGADAADLRPARRGDPRRPCSRTPTASPTSAGRSSRTPATCPTSRKRSASSSSSATSSTQTDRRSSGAHAARDGSGSRQGPR